MSDSAQVLAAKVDDGVVRERAKTMLDWLVGQGIVEAEEGESDLGNPAYRPGRRVLEVVEVQGPDFYDFRRLVTNGMELTVNPSPPLQSSGDELPTFRCPACAAEIDGEPLLEWALGDRDESVTVPRVACAACGAACLVTDLIVEDGAFGNLVLRFWNWWPLKKVFIAELEGRFDVEFVQLWERW